MGCFACPCSSGVADVAVSLDRLALPGEVAAGWLMKKGRKVRTKRRRFFVLKVGALEYYEDEGRATLKGTIPLWPRTVVSFVAKGPDADRGKIRVKHAEAGDERDLYASSVAEAEAWVGALERLQEDCRRGGAREGYLHKRGGWSRGGKTGDSSSLQHECAARSFRKKHPRFEGAPRDDRPSKNEPKRVETDRERSL